MSDSEADGDGEADAESCREGDATGVAVVRDFSVVAGLGEADGRAGGLPEAVGEALVETTVGDAEGEGPTMIPPPGSEILPPSSANTMKTPKLDATTAMAIARAIRCNLGDRLGPGRWPALIRSRKGSQNWANETVGIAGRSVSNRSRRRSSWIRAKHA